MPETSQRSQETRLTWLTAAFAGCIAVGEAMAVMCGYAIANNNEALAWTSGAAAAGLGFAVLGTGLAFKNAIPR